MSIKKGGNEGYHVATDEYLELVKAGVVDPAKVTRYALQNAASISALMLTTGLARSSSYGLNSSIRQLA